MKKEMMKKFDDMMKALKTIEPGHSFDFEFQKKLEKAVTEKQKETAFEKVKRQTLENLELIFMPRMPKIATATAGAGLVFAIIFFIFVLQPATPVVLSKTHSLMVRKSGAAEWKTARADQRFTVGDIISARANTYADISVEGKYTMRLKERTELKIVSLTPKLGKGKAVFELRKGLLFADIDKKRFKGSGFEIVTDTAVTSALGTKFAVGITSRNKTDVSVIEGEVKVKSKKMVIVKAGQKTSVLRGEDPAKPRRLLEKEWSNLEELYQIGKKARVMLILKFSPNRVKELLGPCPIYISDEKPRTVPLILEEAVMKIKEALEKEDRSKHLESVKLIERIAEEHPNPDYDVQFLLYVGAYYEYLDMHSEAIASFQKVIRRYPESGLASLAQCAIGVIYGEKLNKKEKADKVYRLVLEVYPNSLEAIWAEERLGIKKLVKKSE